MTVKHEVKTAVLNHYFKSEANNAPGAMLNSRVAVKKFNPTKMAKTPLVPSVTPA